MLVLTRRLGEGLTIGDNIKITVEKISKSEMYCFLLLTKLVIPKP
jgi:carbon storage regulator CsrA